MFLYLRNVWEHSRAAFLALFGNASLAVTCFIMNFDLL